MNKLAEYLQQQGLSQKDFALRLEPPATQSAVAQWVAGMPIKAERVLDAAAKTEWTVRPNEWRPDLYPHPDDGMPTDRRGEVTAACG